MNHSALVLIACLAGPTSFAAAQNALKNSALGLSMGLDDETTLPAPVRTADGALGRIGIDALP